MSLTTPTLAALNVISTAGQTYSTYQAERAQGRYERSIYNTNARLANLAAEDARRRGETEANRVRRQTRALRGTQRAGFAGQGVAVDSGTPGFVGAETEAFGAFDVMAVKNNALREAFGFKMEALDFRTRSRFAGIASRSRARSAVFAGVQRVVGFAALGREGRFASRNPTERRFQRDFERDAFGTRGRR